jgi:hypothetical protein
MRGTLMLRVCVGTALLLALVSSSVGLAAGDPPRRSWAAIAWGRVASYATSADDQVAAAQRVLRMGMTREEAQAALDAPPHAERAFGTGDLLSLHELAHSRRFRKTTIWLTFRQPLEDEDDLLAPALLESWSVSKRQ